MKLVTKDEFFAAMNCNVHPRPDVSTFKGRFHISHWEMQDNSRRVLGMCRSDSWAALPTEYYLA